MKTGRPGSKPPLVAVMNFRTTDEEANAISQEATKAGMSEMAYLRLIIRYGREAFRVKNPAFPLT